MQGDYTSTNEKEPKEDLPRQIPAVRTNFEHGVTTLLVQGVAPLSVKRLKTLETTKTG